MAQFTQKAIIQTFYEMLETTPFDKITVSAIVATCGISSNTFYYHFRDIYDLLDTWLLEVRDQYFHQSGEYDTWQDMLKTLLYDVEAHPEIVNHILGSLSRERLERYIFESANETIYAWVCNKTADQKVSEECLRDIANFYQYALLGFFLKYIWGHMSFDINESVDRLSVLFESFIEQAVANYEKYEATFRK